MVEDPLPPRLRPPPRVPLPGDRRAEDRDGATWRASAPARAAPLAILFAALVVALIGVFVILPRWAGREGDRTREVEASTPAAIPAAAAPTTADETASPASRPGPPPPPWAAPTPPAGRTEVSGRGPTEGGRAPFAQAMSRGLARLEDEDWQGAAEAFEEAARLRPEAPEVADGLARAAAGARRARILAGIATAGELEAGERWAEAEREYEEALTLDPEAASALDGRARATARRALDDRLQYHLEHPARLTSHAVFDEASELLRQGRDTQPQGPRLQDQLVRLGELLRSASTPLPVVLESDMLTEVVVYRVGRLGFFARRELSLRPGTYTAVGSRDGFRDVRIQFEVRPGTPQQPISVRCTEGL